jgi:hypothetical protein
MGNLIAQLDLDQRLSILRRIVAYGPERAPSPASCGDWRLPPSRPSQNLWAQTSLPQLL